MLSVTSTVYTSLTIPIQKRYEKESVHLKWYSHIIIACHTCYLHNKIWLNLYLTRAEPGGGVWTSLSSYWHTCSYIFSAHFVKISEPGPPWSDHQVRSSDLTSDKFWMFVIATPNERSPGNSQRLISVPVSMKRLYRNFDIGDLCKVRSILRRLHYR